MMNFKQSAILLLLLITAAASYAQRAKGETVYARFLSLPAHDILTTDISRYTGFYSVQNSSYGSKTMHEYEAPCAMVDSKGKIQGVEKVTLFFYSIPVERGKSYLSVKDDQGNVVFAEKLRENKNEELYFGRDEECTYWLPILLEGVFQEAKDEWKAKDQEEFRKKVYEDAKWLVWSEMSLSYIDHTFEVFTGKGRGNDYTELDHAQQQALNAYARIKIAGGINQEILDRLAAPIQTWEKYAKQVDWEDNRAYINKRVGRGLLMNLATAHLYRSELDKAIEYALAAERSYGNFYNSDRSYIQDLMYMAERQRRGIEVNQAIATNYTLLNEKAKAAHSVRMEMVEVEPDMLHFIEEEYHNYNNMKLQGGGPAASGGDQGGSSNNPYEQFITDTPKGRTLLIYIFDKELTSFPVEVTELEVDALLIGGNSMKDVAPEIGDMTGLIELDLSANEFTEVPEEIGDLINLENLNLSRNKISSLPESIQQLTNLKKLNIKKTNISEAEVARIQAWLPDCDIKF